MDNERPRVAVLGTGLIGGSILRRLVMAGYDAIGWDPDIDTNEFAREQGVPFADTVQAAVAERDIVFLGAPLRALPAILDGVSKLVTPDCVITDVGSTKTGIAEHALATPAANQFIPGHPMAGTENSGLTSADAALFHGAAWVLCPPPCVPIDRLRALIGLVVSAFGARVSVMTPSEHDTVVALSSHIPHLLAGSLAGATSRAQVKDGVLGLAAGSFRDGTRVAGTAPARTVDMLTHNRDAVLSQLDLVRGYFDELVSQVREGDSTRLRELFSTSQSLRHELVDRSMGTATRRIAHNVDADTERGFLLDLGSRGGHVIGCAVDDTAVTYTVLAPVNQKP